MQILPNQSSTPTLGDALFAQDKKGSSGGDSFADHMVAQQEAQQAVDEGSQRSVTTALAAENQPAAPLQEAPYSVKSKTDSGTYTLEEVCFSKTELVELREKLIAAGAPPETLEKFDKLVNQPDGATLAQITASLQQLQKPIQFTDDEKNVLKGLLKKIDSTGALEEKILGLMEGGQGMAAFKMLSQALSGLDPSAHLSIDKSEIAVLGKALGLSSTGQQQLLAGFGSGQSFDLNPAQITQLLSPAQSDLVQREANQKTLNKAFDATITPILQKARKRMQAEKDATSLQSRQVEQSKIMINKTVTSTASATVEGAAAKAGEDATTGTDAVKGSNVPDKGATQQTEQKQEPQPVQTNAVQQQAQGKGEASAEQLKTQLKGDGAKNPTTEQNATVKSAEHDKQIATQKNNADLLRDQTGPDDRNATDDTKSGNTGWESLLSKVEVRPQAATNTTQTVVGNIQGVHTGLMTAGANATTDTGTPAHISRQVSSQVEQAMLSAMRDGSKKLELQLNPIDLGSLTLTLTTRNGEVSATIRSERTETADLMVRQLDVLRTNLEQQGIKIDKLEVQTQGAGMQNESWQGMQQHNAQQEEHARREQSDRLRNLGRSRNSSINVNETTLEQGLQLTARTAENAAQSIHIVA